MPKLLSFLAAFGLAVLAALPAGASGGPEEIRAIAIKAANLLAEKGVEGAKPAFYANGEFKHGEIYVNVIDQQGVWLIYPPRPSAEGRSVLDVKDVDGKFLVKEILSLANSRGEGWVEYRWLNPVTNQIQLKVTYVKTVPSRNVIAYVGIYK